MRVAIFSCLLLLAATSSAARANPDSVPLLCGGSDVDLDARPSGPSDLPGTYRCSEEGVTITLRLIADRRFEQRMVADEPMFETEGGGLSREFNLKGEWRVENGEGHLFARPLHEPRLSLVEANRDPSVALRIEVRTADGQSPSDLYVGQGEDANPRSALDDGVLTVPAEEGTAPGRRWIFRSGDNRRLASVDVTPGGTNSWSYIYEPSELEPFDHRALFTGDAVVVPLGIAGAVLRRVGGEP
ncbi:MAG: hypothetical protein DI606_16620 [Sphingobium sp.]|uniref:hypothetical protein n=1 Tax=Sphingobium sp. TaxID=1912891 RepID=UPI000DB134A0|nr:hypothetical protein [Sphingobium sp.]PZU07386.1 MAG: hypothetical protein DI606_16620 [Sphingobium sp.]